MKESSRARLIWRPSRDDCSFNPAHFIPDCPWLLPEPFTDFSFGGSANDSISGVAIDAAQNIYVAGTTFSADLPLRNASQTVNSGTQLIYSTDAGASWKPFQ